jgi:hypothetical protein
MPIKFPKPCTVKDAVADLDKVDASRIKNALHKPQLTTGLDHWTLWLLVGLSKHVARQKWAAGVVESLLEGDLRKIGTLGSLAHAEEADQSGKVPDCHGWTYRFHGRGCCLVNDRDGMEIDFDADEQGDCCKIDPYFYSNFLKSLAKPELAESILQKPSALDRFWHADLEPLKQLDCWQNRKVTENGLKLYKGLRPVFDALSKLHGQPGLQERIQDIFLSLQIGDIVRAADIATSDILPESLVGEIKHAARKSKISRAARLKVDLAKPDGKFGIPLQALAELGSEYSKEDVVKCSFRSPVDGAANCAVEILNLWQLSDLELILTKLVEKRAEEAENKDGLDDDSPRDTQFVKVTGILLLKRNELSPKTKTSLIRVLKKIQTASEGEAAFLLYILEKKKGLQALGAALVSEIPLAYFAAAAACFLIGTAETKHLLIKTLQRRGTDLEQQHAAAYALSKADPKGEISELSAWQRANDGISEPVTYSLHAGMAEYVDSAINDLRPLAPLLLLG